MPLCGKERKRRSCWMMFIVQHLPEEKWTWVRNDPRPCYSCSPLRCWVYCICKAKMWVRVGSTAKTAGLRDMGGCREMFWTGSCTSQLPWEVPRSWLCHVCEASGLHLGTPHPSQDNKGTIRSLSDCCPAGSVLRPGAQGIWLDVHGGLKSFWSATGHGAIRMAAVCLGSDGWGRPAWHQQGLLSVWKHEEQQGWLKAYHTGSCFCPNNLQQPTMLSCCLSC